MLANCFSVISKISVSYVIQTNWKRKKSNLFLVQPSSSRDSSECHRCQNFAHRHVLARFSSTMSDKVRDQQVGFVKTYPWSKSVMYRWQMMNGWILCNKLFEKRRKKCQLLYTLQSNLEKAGRVPSYYFSLRILGTKYSNSHCFAFYVRTSRNFRIYSTME
jgi:hypothetical protein